MEQKEFKITINAQREKVWNALWDDANYRQWTSVFAEGSQAVTDWEEGSKVLFTDGKGEGMVSKIAKKTPNEYMSFMHLGELKNGVEDTESEKVKEWSGGTENYTLKAVDTGTELIVDMGVPPEHMAYFMDTFPKALQKVKEIAEQ